MKYKVSNPSHRQIAAEALLEALKEAADRDFAGATALAYVVGRLANDALRPELEAAHDRIRSALA